MSEIIFQIIGHFKTETIKIPITQTKINISDHDSILSLDITFHTINKNIIKSSDDIDYITLSKVKEISNRHQVIKKLNEYWNNKLKDHLHKIKDLKLKRKFLLSGLENSEIAQLQNDEKAYIHKEIESLSLLIGKYSKEMDTIYKTPYDISYSIERNTHCIDLALGEQTIITGVPDQSSLYFHIKCYTKNKDTTDKPNIKDKVPNCHLYIKQETTQYNDKIYIKPLY